MDAARSGRKFPGYTIRQLEEAVAAGHGNDAMIAEIAARKNGTSRILATPQIEGGKVKATVGRM